MISLFLFQLYESCDAIKICMNVSTKHIFKQQGSYYYHNNLFQKKLSMNKNKYARIFNLNNVNTYKANLNCLYKMLP